MVTLSEVKIAGWDRFSGEVKNQFNEGIKKTKNSLLNGGKTDTTNRQQ
jgi:hypothetical protein